MSLRLILLAIATLLASGALSAFAGRRDRAALLIGTTGALAAAVAGVGASLWALLDRDAHSLQTAWRLPIGEVDLGIDPLSAFFLLCVFTVTGLAALYGAGYFAHMTGQTRLSGPVALMNILAASMAALVIARDGVVFLAAWEVMSLASFFLVLVDGAREETRKAAIVYLIASQAGVVPIFVMFLVLAVPAGSFSFAAMTSSAAASGFASVAFLLAVVGFGAKAGFWPMHVWLPEAHPAAPSPVSAVMSGVMIKMGIYGLLRTISFLGTPPAWWGVLVLCIGVVSGIGGVLHALAQHDLKRLLAYHSVENIGIIALGLGLGLLGHSLNEPAMAFLGYGGAALHVLNHGLFKGLLFQGAGSVQHGVGTRHLDSLGGLSRRMPVTGLTFLVGSAAISGLPPLNGFVSEVLIYSAAFVGASQLSAPYAGWALAAIPSLALIGGLAAACFVKAYGIVFLGEPRSEAASKAHESGTAMKLSMLAGAALCLVIGILPTTALALIGPVGMQMSGRASPPPLVGEILSGVARGGAILVAVCAVLVIARRLMLKNRDVRTAPTWGCGYEAPTARMQYTAPSFAQPVIDPFRTLLHAHTESSLPHGFFPTSAATSEHLGDRADRVFRALTRWLLLALAWPVRLERGGTRRYLVYVLVTLVALLVWQLALQD